MRGLWSTLVLLVVLIGLGGYIYFTGAKPADTGSKQEKVFAGVDADKVQEIKVKSESGDATTLKKEGGAWKIVAPVSAAASDADAQGIANTIGSLEIDRVVDENPADLKDYGLAQPRIDIEFKSSDGKPSGRLRIGNKTVTGGNVYAMRNDDKKVVTVAEYQQASLNKSTFDLRDKSLVKFERDKVDGLDVTVDGKPIEMAKSNGDWRLVKPIAARADLSAVEGLVGKVEGAQMKSVVTAEPEPAELKKYGLDKPSVTVDVRLGTAHTSLMIGGKAPDGTYYARTNAKPDVYTIDASVADDLKKPADDYRRHDLFEFRAFNATRVDITRNGQTVAFERVKSDAKDQPDKWRRVAPTAGEPDRQKVQDFLAGLADMRATSFVDAKAKTGLDMPAMVVVAKYDDGKKEERVTFGRNGSDVYAARADDPGAAKIEAEKFDEAVKALDELSK
jgi:Domain of unknown function (DUF4340)